MFFIINAALSDKGENEKKNWNVCLSDFVAMVQKYILLMRLK